MNKLLDSLHELLPSSRSISSEFYLSADALIQSLTDDGHKVAMIQIPEFDAGNLDDDKLVEIIFKEHHNFHRGIVLIHAPACSRYNLGEFSCQADNLKQFIRNYDVEMLFDGDVVFLAPESKTISIFHHEGAFLHVKLQEKTQVN